MHRQRIRAHPPVQQRRVVPLPEVLQPDLDVLFLPSEARLRRGLAARIAVFPGAIRSLESQRPEARFSCSDENPRREFELNFVLAETRELPRMRARTLVFGG